jgi:altronate hydrolase
VRSALVISDLDTVATALMALEPGRHLTTPRGDVVVIESIPPGHKVAIVAMPAGTQVFKYGSPIGLAISHIAPGAHVHTHNVASSRGRGDLPSPDAGDAEGRLAEPTEPALGPLGNGKESPS